MNDAGDAGDACATTHGAGQASSTTSSHSLINMLKFRTNFTGYSVEFSPFEERKLACATAQHFGIIGNGKQYIFDVHDREIAPFRSFDSREGLYDCSWSEENENHLVSVSGDGSVKLWDIHSPGNPLRSFEEHTHEIYSVDWNLVQKDIQLPLHLSNPSAPAPSLSLYCLNIYDLVIDTFITGSWDDSIKLWNPREDRSLCTYKEHQYCVYGTVWSPRLPDVFASVSGDYTLKIWNYNDTRSMQTIRAHDYEVLTCDWNKYNENEVVTGSVDKTIKIWDLRNPSRAVSTLRGHTYAVRRVKFSPHSDSVLASCSYDMSVMLWDLARQDPMTERLDHHTEFVVGIDFNMFIEGQVASCSWDESVAVWNMLTRR